jgi:ABC-type phosphate/phosphonate transport system substrate-binding protein
MRSITLFVPAAREVVEPLMSGLLPRFRGKIGLDIAPIYVSAPTLLPELLDVARDAAAWLPSFTAYVLSVAKLAAPIAAAERRADPPHHAMLVARPGVEGLGGLEGKRVGWVSKLSVTGYEIPRLYLESFGMDVPSLFAEHRFCGSHHAAARALERGEVDVVATHSGHAEALTLTANATILASIGPIPPDVVVAGSEMAPETSEALVQALVETGAFTRAKRTHLGIFEILSAEPVTRDLTKGSRSPQGTPLVA